VLHVFVSEGLLSYSMPQGVQRGTEVDLSDRTYDGREESGYLSSGLGQLVDGQKGQDIFRLDLMGHGKGKLLFLRVLDNNFLLSLRIIHTAQHSKFYGHEFGYFKDRIPYW
jgi:hypothetical protein